MPILVERPTTKPAAAKPAPLLEALSVTHQELLDQLAALRAWMADMDEFGVNARLRDRAAALLAFFETHARGHHAIEEKQVFPPLLAEGRPETVDLIHRLQQDHGWLEEDWLELAPQLGAIAHGHGGYDLDTLRAGIEVFCALYLEHIALEDAQAYPQVRKLLDRRDL